MRGGKLLNNWRMAQLHAQEAPERVRELEQWGAIFDRTEDGKILQRAFGGHTYKRLCHVGDRTGLEMIRTLQDRGVQQGFDVLHGVHHHAPADGRRPLRAARSATGAKTAASSFSKPKSVVMATGGIGKAWTDHLQLLGVHRRRHGARLRSRRGIDGHGICAVSSDRNGLAAGRAGNSRHRSGARRRRHPAQQMGERFMEKYDPKRMELSTRDVVARSIYTEVKEGRGTEHGGAYLDISHKPAEYVKKKLPSMYHQFKELADVDITKGPMEVGPTCHYVMGGIRVEAETGAVHRAGNVCGGRSRGGFARRESPGRQFAFGFAGVWPARGNGCGGARERNCLRRPSITRRSRRPRKNCLRRFQQHTAKVPTRFIAICRR